MAGALLAYALLLQAFAGAFATGAMAGAAPDPLLIICSDSGGGHADQSSAPDHKPECPCAVLCQLGAGFHAAVIGVEPSQPSLVRFATILSPSFGGQETPTLLNAGLFKEARAPPALSV